MRGSLPLPCFWFVVNRTPHLLASALLLILDVVYVTCGGLCLVVCLLQVLCTSHTVASALFLVRTSHAVASAHTLSAVMRSQRHLLASLYGRHDTSQSPAPCQHMLASALPPILDVVYVTCGGLCLVVCCSCCVRHIRWPLPCLSSGMPSTSHVVASAHTLGSLIPGCLPPAGMWSQRHFLASLHGRLDRNRT